MHSNLASASSFRSLQTVVLLRWVLIVATSYLVLFSQPLAELAPTAGLFIAAYFGSNLLLSVYLPRVASSFAIEVGLVLFDIAMVSLGLALTPNASSQFFVVYFVVVFISALSERLGLIVAAALLVSATHLYTTAQFMGWGLLAERGYTLRIPFLFVVALFFGHLVSEARRRERDAEEAHRHQLRAEFMSSVSHDMKNSLGVIESLAMLLLDGAAGELNAEQASLVRRVHASTRHVITFALNLIDSARIEAGQLLLWPQPTNLADVVEDAMLLASSASELRSVRLHCEVDPGLPLLHVDGVQLERVVSNLLGNAIKFTPTGGAVTLSVRRRGDHVVLEVEDTGTGIPAAELPTIFDRHRPVTRHRPMQGTGLGLSIVKAIVQAHGGTVVVASAIGQGTTVTVSLPLPPSPPALTVTPVLQPQHWQFTPSIEPGAG